MNKNGIKDKVVMVTGASRGMGRFFCKYFAERGAKIAAIARTTDRKSEKRKSLKSYLNSALSSFQNINPITSKIKMSLK